eukprot:gene24502-10099_t
MNSTSPAQDDAAAPQPLVKAVHVLFGSQKGTSKSFAEQLALACKLTLASETSPVEINCTDLSLGFEPEKMLQFPAGTAVLVVISTYEEGAPPDGSKWFCRWLEESSTDWRVGSALQHLAGFSVFGCGNSIYPGPRFNQVAKAVDSHFAALGAKRLHAVGLGDEDAAAMVQGGMIGQFKTWSNKVVDVLQGDANKAVTTPLEDEEDEVVDVLQGDAGKAVATPLEDEDDDVTEYALDEEDEDEEDDDEIDMEDIGGAAPKGRKYKAGSANGKAASGPPDMITPMLRQSLTKQGYKLIGSHSGV